MANKRFSSSPSVLAVAHGSTSSSRTLHFQPTIAGRKTRKIMTSKTNTHSNDYVCAIERTQNGKYNVRVRAVFAAPKMAEAHRSTAGWILPVYFLASSFNAAMKKLEETVQVLQKSEDRLRFWGLERTDDPNMAGDLLQGFGIRVDRRRDFPRKIAEMRVVPERPVSASILAFARRTLAESIGPERPLRALAGD